MKKKKNENRNFAFWRWCDYAVCFIKYKPDRKWISEELYGHLEDKYDHLVSSGMDEKEAEKEALKAMGDASEVGRELAKVHKPFLGYLLRCTKVILVLAIISLIIHSFNIIPIVSRYINGGMESVVEENLWNTPEEGDIFYYPDCRDKSDGYIFTIPRVLTSDDPYSDGTHPFYFTVKSFNVRPWIGPAELREFYAVDSFGNYYYPNSSISREDTDRSLVGNYYYGGYLTYKYEMWLEGYVGGAEWVEIRYDSFGRDICLRIDLGEGAEYEAY